VIFCLELSNLGTVSNILDNKPHISGNAVCLCCGSKWVAVAEIGSVELECPECHTYKGVYEGMTAPDDIWQCDCGNQHFYISRDAAVCARCGLSQVF